jgi:LysR family hydrogen peroxide-inducible transcriptional activator
MNLRELRYVLAVAEHLHFGRAAEACAVSQPTLSTQLRKLEEELGIVLFERGGRGVALTPIGAEMLPQFQAVVTAADAIQHRAAAARDPLAGRFRLGVIPTLAPYLLPLVFGPLQAALPRLSLEPWEDVTNAVLAGLRAHELDAALIATLPDGLDLTGEELFQEPFLAALPPEHPLTARTKVAEADLAPDVLVLSDGHCLREQALSVCSAQPPEDARLRAASLPTLLNMVAAGYGTTLIPGLAAGVAQDAGLVLKPLAGGAGRMVRLVWRASFPRREAVAAIAGVIRDRLAGFSSPL